MSEEKLDFIIGQLCGLTTSVNNLESRMDKLENEFSDFKKQVVKSLQTLQTRINTLESQLLSIGLELKNEIKRKIKRSS